MKVTLDLSAREVRALRTVCKSAVADGRDFEELEGQAFVEAAKERIPAYFRAEEREKAETFLNVYRQLL